ncbi:hypothetical protein [Promicromonospora kroppenstedtii]|uniref:hypothetical protein n=1 Tax=Promicromonospora kroppenstedtii TaxID=440482 RepID=UPI0004B2A449|nr:hypothetical protein [Promicromonospora kroppenstedtii]
MTTTRARIVLAVVGCAVLVAAAVGVAVALAPPSQEDVQACLAVQGYDWNPNSDSALYAAALAECEATA